MQKRKKEQDALLASVVRTEEYRARVRHGAKTRLQIPNVHGPSSPVIETSTILLWKIPGTMVLYSTAFRWLRRTSTPLCVSGVALRDRCATLRRIRHASHGEGSIFAPWHFEYVCMYCVSFSDPGLNLLQGRDG